MNPEDFDARGVPLGQAMWNLYQADQIRRANIAARQLHREEQAERLHKMGLTRLADQFKHWSQPLSPEDLEDYEDDGHDNKLRSK